MSIPFERYSYPYEFIHMDDDNINIEITFKEEQSLTPLTQLTDYEILRNALNGWHNQCVTFTGKTIRNIDKKYKDEMQSLIKIVPGIISHISFENLNIEFEALYELLTWLNMSFNFSKITVNEVLYVKIYGDLSKIIRNEQPSKGFVENFTYDVKYTKTEEKTSKFIFNLDTVVDLRDRNRNPFEPVFYKWNMLYVDMWVPAGRFYKKCKAELNDSTYILTIPGNGINTKNLFFLLLLLEYYYTERYFKSLEIFSNEMPPVEGMTLKPVAKIR